MRRADSHEPLQMMPWWVARWLASKAKAVMTVEQQGAYRNLLDHAWVDENCSLSQDGEELRKLAGCTPEEWERSGPTVLLWFTERDDRFVSIPQKKEWQLAMKKRVLARRRAKKAGIKSGSVRRSRTNSKFTPSSTQVELTANYPSPSPSQSQSITATDSAAVASPPREPLREKVVVTPDVVSWSGEATDIWRAAYDGDPTGKFYGGMKPIVSRYGWERTKPVLTGYLSETPVEYVNLGTLLSGFGEFERRSQGNGRVRDGPKRQTAADVTTQAVQSIMRKAREAESGDQSGAVLDGPGAHGTPAQPAGERTAPRRLPPGDAGRDGRG